MTTDAAPLTITPATLCCVCLGRIGQTARGSYIHLANSRGYVDGHFATPTDD